MSENLWEFKSIFQLISKYVLIKANILNVNQLYLHKNYVNISNTKVQTRHRISFHLTLKISLNFKLKKVKLGLNSQISQIFDGLSYCSYNNLLHFKFENVLTRSSRSQNSCKIFIAIHPFVSITGLVWVDPERLTPHIN